MKWEDEQELRKDLEGGARDLSYFVGILWSY
jgi:hypothetical protein